MAFAYTLERSYKLHIHLALILDCKDHPNPDDLFVDQVIPAIKKLKYVMGCKFNKRCNADSYYHDLSVTPQFRDAIERYSYYAKTNQKSYVPDSFKKTFGTTQIKNTTI